MYLIIRDVKMKIRVLLEVMRRGWDKLAYFGSLWFEWL